jgi:hypothetical protein
MQLKGHTAMELTTIEDIERAISALPPQELTQLYAWIDEHRPPHLPSGRLAPTLFEQGMGLFGSPDDAALLDEVVRMAYEERRHPSHPPDTL